MIATVLIDVIVHSKDPFIYCLPWLVFTILASNHFCLVWSVPPDHSLICQLSSHHYLPVLLCHSPLPDKEGYFVLLVHCDILSCYPSRHAPCGSSSSFLFWVVCHSSRTFHPKELMQEPRIGFPFSPPLDYTLSYLWPMTHHLCICYIGTCSTSMYV